MIDPIQQFRAWLAEAAQTEPNDPNACAVATVAIAADGTPSPDLRMVLLKDVGDEGFTFYTNYESAKGRELDQCPRAALDFHWKTLRRQVRVRGGVVRVPAAESDAYFATRPRASQLSAWASQQSRPLAARVLFEERLREMGDRFPLNVPRPPYWGGFRVVPEEIEFWEDMPGRQHKRHLLRKTARGWSVTLLYP